MIEVIGVSFDDGNRIYYFDSNNIVAKVDDYIINHYSSTLWAEVERQKTKSFRTKNGE